WPGRVAGSTSPPPAGRPSCASSGSVSPAWRPSPRTSTPRCTPGSTAPEHPSGRGYRVPVGQPTDLHDPRDHRDDPTSAGVEQGLTSAQVAERVARGDVNTVPEAPTRTTKQIVRANVFTPVNLVIGILAGLVILAGSPKNALFAGVIVANSVIGVFQELRAKRTLDALRVVSAPKVHVRRDGATVEL